MKIPTLAALILSVLPAGAGAQADFRKEFDAASIKSVAIRAVAGDILFEASPALKVSVEVSQADPQKCSVTVELKGDRLLAEAKNMKKLSWGDSSCRAAFRVRGPAAAKLTAVSVSGNVSASKTSGDVVLETVSGNAKVSEVSGSLRLKTVSGNVVADGFSGTASLETVSGNVTAAGATRSLSLKTVSGNAALSGLAGSLSAETVSGDLKAIWTMPPGKEGIRIETVSGDAELIFPGTTELGSIEAKTLGSVSNEFPTFPAQAPVRFKSISGDLSLKIGKPSGGFLPDRL